jgi:hypothetical protein
MIYRTLQSGFAGDAWKSFSLVAPNVDLVAFRAFAPSDANLDPKWLPQSWTLAQSDDISASAVGNGIIDVTVAPTARGMIASRDVAVIPSRYMCWGIAQFMSLALRARHCAGAFTAQLKMGLSLL